MLKLYNRFDDFWYNAVHIEDSKFDIEQFLF